MARSCRTVPLSPGPVVARQQPPSAVNPVRQVDEIPDPFVWRRAVEARHEKRKKEKHHQHAQIVYGENSEHAAKIERRPIILGVLGVQQMPVIRTADKTKNRSTPVQPNSLST